MANKYKMSKEYQFDIDVSADNYVGKLALPYVTAAVKSPDTVAKGYVRQIDGLNKAAVISGLSLDDPIQVAGCSFNSNDISLALTEQTLTLTDLKVNQEICRGTIFPTWVGENMSRNGDLPSTFSDFLLTTVAAKTGAQLENGLWVSDNANGDGSNGTLGIGFVSNDGTFDQTGLDASACKDFGEAQINGGGGTATDNTNIDDALASVYDKVVGSHPGLIDKPSFGFYMNNKMYGFYGQFLTAAGSGQGINMLGTNQGIGNLTYMGYPIYRCPGMPDDCLVATYKENLVFGTNLSTDWTEARIIPTYQYDGSDNVRIVMNFATGVQTAVASDGVVGANFI